MRSKRNDDRMALWFMVWFAFCALLGLGVTGVMIWAVIKLVVHFTG